MATCLTNGDMVRCVSNWKRWEGNVFWIRAGGLEMNQQLSDSLFCRISDGVQLNMIILISLRIMGSQNWWFGDPIHNPAKSSVKPLFFGRVQLCPSLYKL